jgi:hypothetical protein
MLHKIWTMKIFVASVAAVAGYLLYALGIDVFVHNETLYEALKGFPYQLSRSLGDLFVMAWQYKFVTLVALGIATGIVYVRRVPEIRNL